MIHPVLFYGIAAFTVLCALLVVFLRNVFHAGLFLIGAFLGVSGIYITLNNYFLAAAQALIYSGAIAVLILFGVMMTQKGQRKEEVSHNSFAFLSFLLCAGLLWVLIIAYKKLPEAAPFFFSDLLAEIGKALMQSYALPFEIISVLLLVALIGALAIAREKEEA